ncbi:MAG: nitroreductase [Sphingomonadaceae bacterium]
MISNDLDPEAFTRIATSRRSTRAFLPRAVPEHTLQAIFSVAATAPSNCNTQPWLVEVVSGETRDRISEALRVAGRKSQYTLDYPFDEKIYSGLLGERRAAQGALYYKALGIPRDDRDGRQAGIERNLDFFGAPHAAFLFMPDYCGVRAAADVGMYAQNLLLAMESYGVASCPQTILGFFADTVREAIGIDPENKLLFGISFGYADEQSAANSVRMPRADLDETTHFHQ